MTKTKFNVPIDTLYYNEFFVRVDPSNGSFKNVRAQPTSNVAGVGNPCVNEKGDYYGPYKAHKFSGFTFCMSTKVNSAIRQRMLAYAKRDYKIISQKLNPRAVKVLQEFRVFSLKNYHVNAMSDKGG